MTPQMEKRGGKDFTNYLAMGGKLSQANYDLVMQFPSTENPKDISEQTAGHMGELAGIPLTAKEKTLYATLRGQPIGGEDSCLSDQRLLAEILRITDQKKYEIFTEKFPFCLIPPDIE